MNKIIIASHGELALGMKNTVEFFGGSGVEYVEQTLTDTGFENRVIEITTVDNIKDRPISTNNNEFYLI